MLKAPRQGGTEPLLGQRQPEGVDQLGLVRLPLIGQQDGLSDDGGGEGGELLVRSGLGRVQRGMRQRG